jgi:ribosome-binding ATPase YchF (GTP1/OBG family)
MKVGIIGHKSAGRSTFFSGLTGLEKAAARSGSKTRLGQARVHDPRVDELTRICAPRKTTYAEIVLALLPDPPRGPLDTEAVREMRDLRAYAHVIGAFSGEAVEDAVPDQVAELTTELVLADMERVEKRLTRIGKGGHARTREDELLAAAARCLETERPLRLEQGWDDQQVDLMNELGLMSHRPLITVVNVAEDRLGAPPPDAVVEAAERADSSLMWLCATLEAEIATLPPGEQQEFLAAYGLERPVSQRFVLTGLALLDQICFFTVGPDEVRAWPIRRHTGARRAARAIHSDLERGFIRAEVVDFETFVQQGSEASCRAAGLLRTEGKDYEVQDGDIITVRFNV